MNSSEVNQWICRSIGGDDSAAPQLIEYCRPTTSKIIQARCPNRLCHEDVEQEVYGKIFSRLDQYSGKVPFLNWVSRITVNTCINLYRKQEARPELRMADLSEETEHTLEPTRSDHLQTTDGVAAKELVDKLLETLKPRDRHLVDLVFVKGHTYPEVGELTGINVSLAKTRIFRLRQKLAEHLDRLLSEACPSAAL